MSEITTFLADTWRLFTEVSVPGFNITFSQLYLGVFVVGISIMILRPLLGIGGQATNLFRGVGRRAFSHRRRPSSSSSDSSPTVRHWK